MYVRVGTQLFSHATSSLWMVRFHPPNFAQGSPLWEGWRSGHLMAFHSDTHHLQTRIAQLEAAMHAQDAHLKVRGAEPGGRAGLHDASAGF